MRPPGCQAATLTIQYIPPSHYLTCTLGYRYQVDTGADRGRRAVPPGACMCGKATCDTQRCKCPVVGRGGVRPRREPRYLPYLAYLYPFARGVTVVSHEMLNTGYRTVGNTASLPRWLMKPPDA